MKPARTSQGERYAMNETTNVLRLRQPDEFDDPLADVLRTGARKLLAQAIEIEAETFLAEMRDLKLADGRDRIVRHGHGPERRIQTGIGPVPVSRVKIRDRGANGKVDQVRFSSSILPKWARRTRSLDALLPVLYLRGVSTGDFQEALSALVGKDAPNLSPSVITRLTAEWNADYERWQKRDPSARRYVYVWADGVYLQARMEDQAECMLVLIGATPEGRKELVGFQTGVRESAQSWRELLVDVKRHDLKIAPDIAVGDGALGFWRALLAFYDFPAEHWDHLRTSNPIECVFATVWHRTVRTKGSLSSKTARLMVFKLVMAAAKSWSSIEGTKSVAETARRCQVPGRDRGLKCLHIADHVLGIATTTGVVATDFVSADKEQDISLQVSIGFGIIGLKP